MYGISCDLRQFGFHKYESYTCYHLHGLQACLVRRLMRQQTIVSALLRDVSKSHEMHSFDGNNFARLGMQSERVPVERLITNSCHGSAPVPHQPVISVMATSCYLLKRLETDGIRLGLLAHCTACCRK